MAIGTVVGSGGFELVSAGGITSGTLLNAVERIELLSGMAVGTQVNGGIEVVFGGAVASGATVGNTGIQFIAAGGAASATTVLSGGRRTSTSAAAQPV